MSEVQKMRHILETSHCCKEHKSTIPPSDISKKNIFDADPDRRDKEIKSVKSIKAKIKMFSVEFPEDQNEDPREKNNDFSLKYSSTSAVFSVEIFMEEIELMVADNQKFEN